MKTTLDLSADIIDVRDIIERMEELARDLTDYSAEASEHPELVEEHKTLCDILSQLAGNGGDEQWEGEWYPLTLIRESYFVHYVKEFLEDCGVIPKNLPHYIHIDWQATARDVIEDYTGTEIDGVTYFYR